MEQINQLNHQQRLDQFSVEEQRQHREVFLEVNKKKLHLKRSQLLVGLWLELLNKNLEHLYLEGMWHKNHKDHFLEGLLQQLLEAHFLEELHQPSLILNQQVCLAVLLKLNHKGHFLAELHLLSLQEDRFLAEKLQLILILNQLAPFLVELLQLNHQEAHFSELHQHNQIPNQPALFSVDKYQHSHPEAHFLAELQQLNHLEGHSSELLQQILIPSQQVPFSVVNNQHQMKKSPADHYLVKNNLKQQQSPLQAHFLEFNLSAKVLHYSVEEQLKTPLIKKSSAVKPNPQLHCSLQPLEAVFLVVKTAAFPLLHLSSVHKKLLINLVDRFLGKLTICSTNLKDQSPTKNQNMVTDKPRKKTITTSQMMNHLPSL